MTEDEITATYSSGSGTDTLVYDLSRPLKIIPWWRRLWLRLMGIIQWRK